MPPQFDPTTPLSVLRQLVDSSSQPSDISRLVRNVEQSLRVEGYQVSESDVLLSARRVLTPAA